MSPHQARILRVELLRRAMDDAARRLAAAADATGAVAVLPPVEVLSSPEWAEQMAARQAVTATAAELGRALLTLDAYEAGRPAARKVRP